MITKNATIKKYRFLFDESCMKIENLFLLKICLSKGCKERRNKLHIEDILHEEQNDFEL